MQESNDYSCYMLMAENDHEQRDESGEWQNIESPERIPMETLELPKPTVAYDKPDDRANIVIQRGVARDMNWKQLALSEDQNMVHFKSQLLQQRSKERRLRTPEQQTHVGSFRFQRYLNYSILSSPRFGIVF